MRHAHPHKDMGKHVASLRIFGETHIASYTSQLSAFV